MTIADLDVERVAALRSTALRFGGEAPARKARLLGECAARALRDPAVLVAYHDCLLCLLAYPESRRLADATARELERVAAAARSLMATGRARDRSKLADTGIAWTPVTMQFGWDIARWLSRRFPERADIDSFAADGVPLPSIVAAALPAIEFELCASGETSEECLDRASAGRRGSRLEWLVAALERLPCVDALREHLYESLRAFIVIEPADAPLSRTYCRAPPARVFYHGRGLIGVASRCALRCSPLGRPGGLTRDIDLGRLLARRLPPKRALSSVEREAILDTGRAMLASLGRETDAISLGYADGVELHEVGRGVAVALYPMRPERRSPLDSHVGTMIFKNRMPIGYGGGWPLLGTCRIGVNIFEPYRGGESAFLFGQVLRVYRWRFSVGRFVAEPSQFGGSNREGLQSGAFWFYYRLGFRPVEPRSAALARIEWERIRSDGRYRTPIEALRRFTGSDIELRLHAVPPCEPSALSEAVSQWISARFGGDRSAAQDAAQRKVVHALGIARPGAWRGDERRALRELALVFAQIPDLARWAMADKRAAVALIRAKAGDEMRFHSLLASHPGIGEAIARVASRAAPDAALDADRIDPRCRRARGRA